MSRMFRVEAPNFVAAFVTRGGKVIVAAPILWRLKGKTFGWAQSYCHRLGWTVTLVEEGWTRQAKEQTKHQGRDGGQPLPSPRPHGTISESWEK